ncbi:MAG TPA: 50S ribosomal protein L29 [archaeon]|nr:50S ribosomal protein L29 [archaeon]
MAIIKNKKVRELNDKDMSEKLRELHLEFSKEMASSEIGGSVKNPGRIREVRRTIARIKTERGRRQRESDSKRRGG